MTTVAGQGLEWLRSRFSGRVITAGDGDYDQARSVWNGAIDAHPAVIARCAGAGDVAAAVGFAQDAGLEISVRGGAHNFGGAAAGDDGLTVDLSGISQVTVDPDARTARVGGGANAAAIAPEPGLLAADRDWARQVWQDLLPCAPGTGSYVNFMTDYEADRVRASYGPAKYQRLARVKAAYDPGNAFHRNANINPAG